MKKDFSVCNNGLRENRKTKITNLCIGLTVKLNMVYLFFFFLKKQFDMQSSIIRFKKGIYLSGAWLTFSMIWGRFSVRILLQTCPSMDLPRAGRDTVNLS